LRDIPAARAFDANRSRSRSESRNETCRVTVLHTI
jgi:hypothetical protein